MKITRTFSLIIALAMLVVLVIPAYAQLGDTDTSSITVQNVSGNDGVSVTVKFIAEDGTEYTPTDLGTGITNPFILDDGNSKEIYVPNIPSSQLPSGRYSVVISSTGKVIAIATVAGTGTNRFTGSYIGTGAGQSPFYMPSFYYNFYGWYSMVSVQNLGTNPADITISITCEDGTTGTMTATGVDAMASHHFVTKSDMPTGFAASTECTGSAIITEASGQPLVATDNLNKPATGNTISFTGLTDGSVAINVPALYKGYYGWDSSLNIRKLDAGNTTVTVNYSDAGSSTCALTDAQPGCLLYMPTVHAGSGNFGATITNSASNKLVVVSNSTKGTLSLAYLGIDPTAGSTEVGIPSVFKEYYSWNSSFTCQNVGAVSTKINVAYQGETPYDHPLTLATGDIVEVYQPNETLLTNGYIGGATISAIAAGGEIACIVNFTNNNYLDPSKPGDWSTSYNAFNK